MSIRAPAVAGMFYPADPQVLRQSVRDYLAGAAAATGSVVDGRIKALIVPHAGYQYSGPVAAAAYHLLESVAGSIRRVVLLGPAHRVYLDGMALPASDTFAIPGDNIVLDMAACNSIAPLPCVGVSDEAHAQEHCLEVQIPFLREVLGDFALVPIVVGACSPDPVADVLDALWGGDETLVVVSSDLSHFLPYDDARNVDQDTARAITECRNTLTGHEACGAHAINGLLRVAQRKNLHVDLIEMCNSGDTAGDRSRVVGYGAFALH